MADVPQTTGRPPTEAEMRERIRRLLRSPIAKELGEGYNLDDSMTDAGINPDAVPADYRSGMRWTEKEDEELILMGKDMRDGFAFIASHDLHRTHSAGRRRIKWLIKNRRDFVMRCLTGQSPGSLRRMLEGCSE